MNSINVRGKSVPSRVMRSRFSALIYGSKWMSGLYRTISCAIVAMIVLTFNANAADNRVVVWYASMDTNALQAVVNRFNSTHPGISLQAVWLGAHEIPPRINVEQTAHALRADVVSGDILAISQLAETGALQAFRPPDLDRFLKGTVDRRGYGVALYLAPIVIAWNPTKTKADGLKPPTSLADLAQPGWKGKLGLPAAGINWFAGVMASQHNAAGTLRSIADNRPLIVSGYSLVVSQLEAGEFDATPAAYSYSAQTEKSRGQPVEFIAPRPAIVDVAPVALLKGAPHPVEARIFLDWALSKEGQQFIVDSSNRTSARTDVRNNRNLFDASRPFYILPPSNRSDYAATVRGFDDLFGISG